jgi:hypothetical protein
MVTGLRVNGGGNIDVLQRNNRIIEIKKVIKMKTNKTAMVVIISLLIAGFMIYTDYVANRPAEELKAEELKDAYQAAQMYEWRPSEEDYIAAWEAAGRSSDIVTIGGGRVRKTYTTDAVRVLVGGVNNTVYMRNASTYSIVVASTYSIVVTGTWNTVYYPHGASPDIGQYGRENRVLMWIPDEQVANDE